MRVLIVHASRHGTTKEIAERIGQRLTEAGLHAVVRSAKEAPDLSEYGAVIVGGAAYFGTWLKDAAQFVRRHRDLLAERPVWLFSCGPLKGVSQGESTIDPLAAAEPKEFATFRETIHPRGTRVFYGALDPEELNLFERVIKGLPAGRAMFPEGDFREWPEIDAWADGIAHEFSVTN